MKRLPKEKRLIKSRDLSTAAAIEEARKELDRSRHSFSRFTCGRADPLELNGFRGPRQHRNERGSE
jgi:hypothetical protein